MDISRHRTSPIPRAAFGSLGIVELSNVALISAAR
jgi:hypothetical protein